AIRDIREAVGGDAGDVSPVDVLSAFVDAARGADSYAGALHAVLTSVCDERGVESAGWLARRDAPKADYGCLVASGALTEATPDVAADGALISPLRAYPRPLPLGPTTLGAL